MNAPAALDIHLINPMTDIGGSELHTLDMHRVLSRYANATIWSERRPAAQFAQLAPIQRINFPMLRFPKTGVFVFLGCYFEVGQWWRWARPTRTILLYNISNPRRLKYARERLSLGGQRTLEMVYASEAMRAEAGLPGAVEDSPINLTVFAPDEYKRRDAPPKKDFVVGRTSRDEMLKFHAHDPALFERLAGWGINVRIAGGSCLREHMRPHPRIRLQPMISPLELPQFLRGLDCFIYRTAAELSEAYGRVVAEAMACGVPVIVTRTAGIAQYIRHGVDGFVADHDEDIVEIVMALRDDPQLRQRIGTAARRCMEQRYGVEQLAKIAQFYLRPPQPAFAPQIARA